MRVPGPLEQAWTAWTGAIDCTASQRFWTADELRQQSQQASKLLTRHGVEEGQRVALLLSNTAAFPVWLMACLSLGACPVLLAVGTTDAELDGMVASAGISWALHNPTDPASSLSARASTGLGRVAGEDTQLLAFPTMAPSRVPVAAGALLHATSGTYGHAQLCVRNQRVAVAEAENFLGAIDAYDRCRVRLTTPLSHAFAFGFGLVAALLSHSTLVLDRSFNPRRLLLQERDQVSDIIALVPSMVKLLATMGRAVRGRLGSIGFYAGAPCAAPLREELEAVFQTRLYAIYGSTETGGISTNYRSGGGDGVGTALPGVAVSIRAQAQYESLGAGVGEVWVRSTAFMQGYLDADFRTDSDGFFNTRDLGRMDAAGTLTLVGRIKDMINLGGRKVDPAQVESALLAAPGVQEAAVYPGASDGREFVQAALKMAPGQPLDEAALTRHCAARLEEYKLPTSYHRVDALPRSASGKCLKFHCPGWGIVS